jgi:hypothetical protein
VSIYQKFPKSSPVNQPGVHDPFTHEKRESDFELPAGYVNPRVAVKQAVEALEHYEPSRLKDIATGMILLQYHLSPARVKFLLAELHASPISADTADHILESLQFMNSHDRQSR